MSYIPGKINNFNLYQGTASESSKLLGVTAEVTLPNFQYVSETLNMAGMAGEIDDPSAGQLQSSTIEIPFSNISKENIDLARNDQIPLSMRAAQEMINKSEGIQGSCHYCKRNDKGYQLWFSSEEWLRQSFNHKGSNLLQRGY